MEEATGTTYNTDLDRIFKNGLADNDREKVVKLAEYLGGIHKRAGKPELYIRRARDLVGHGEYIMGVLDGYPDSSIDSEKKIEIVSKCVKWWEKLRKYKNRISVIHGDYHPFNIVFKDGTIQNIESEFQNELVVYPNPARNNLFIKSNFVENFDEVSIISLNGRTVLQKNYFSTSSALNISHLQTGIYIVQIKTPDEIILKKIIVSR